LKFQDRKEITQKHDELVAKPTDMQG